MLVLLADVGFTAYHSFIAFEKSSEIAPGSGQRFAAPGVYKSTRTVSLL